MILRGLVVFLLTVIVTEVKGQDCSGSGADLRDKAWEYERGTDGRRKIVRFTDTTIDYYDHNSPVAIESLTCKSFETTTPVTHFFAELEEAGGTTRYFCVEIVDTQADVSLVHLYRRYEVDAADATRAIDPINSGVQCKDEIFAPTKVGYEERLLITVNVNMDALGVESGFAEVFDSGFCTNNIVEAYDQPAVSPDDAATLPSQFYTMEWSDDSAAVDQPFCVGDSTSRLTREGSVIDMSACATNRGSTYWNPTGLDIQCLGNVQRNALNLEEDADIQLVAITDATDGEYYFACMRYKKVSNEPCVEFSLELTDKYKPGCSVTYDNQQISQTTALRDANNKGFISVKACTRDCTLADPADACVFGTPGEAQHSSECTQGFGSYLCSCNAGYEGDRCEANIDDCTPNPCLNDGVCNDRTLDFVCVCNDGYKGERCEIETCRIPEEWRLVDWFYQYEDTPGGTTISVNFVDITNFEVGDDEYECEFDTSVGIWTGSAVLTLDDGGTPASNITRTCLQVVYLASNLEGVSDTRGFLLFRKTADADSEQKPAGTCAGEFSADNDPFQVLIAPSAVFVDTAPVSPGPFDAGPYYQLTWSLNGITHCAGDSSSTATLSSNVFQASNPCDADQISGLNPVAQTWYFAAYWGSSLMGDPNSNTNGDNFLIAIGENTNNQGELTWYCGRYETGGPLTFHLSVYFRNGLSPHCLVNDNAQNSDDANHLHVMLTSNVCDRTTPCQNDGTCTDGPGNQEYRCECPDGFEGTNCETNIDECSPQPCRMVADGYGGIACSDLINDFECLCEAGWTGRICDERDPCEDDDAFCDNFGTCLPRIDTYVCACVAGWTGDHCETDINECESNPCQNGGVCSEDEDGAFRLDYYECDCPSGYHGTNCELEDDYCTPNPCHNGGTCINYPERATFYCRCQGTGHIWDLCQHEDECETVGCHDENTLWCEDRLDERVCICKDGFVGGQPGDEHFNGDCSEVDTSNPCHSAPCEHDGICHQDDEDPDEWNCECVGNFDGPTCGERLVTCDDNPCPGNIDCLPQPRNSSDWPYLCDCPSHLTGRNCENEDDGFGVVEQALIGLLCALVIACCILALCALCSNRCGPCGPKGDCCRECCP